MKASIVTLLALTGAALGANQMAMDRLVSIKTSQRASQRERGMFRSQAYPSKKNVPCVDGMAGEYACENVDLMAFLSHEDMGSVEREGNDIWGWTSPDGREFGVIGQSDGTAFVEVKADGSLDYVGRLAVQTDSSIWRDMKVIDGYAYIGSEADDYGMQVFDMRKLLNISSFEKPKAFALRDLTAHFSEFGNSHNIVSHEETNMIYAVGTNRNGPCAGGLFMVDVSDPANPVSPGCASDDGYVHDAQCVIYSGPDSEYEGHEICFGYNEDTFTIYDVTDKSSPVTISSTPYEGAAYTHQGWLVDTANMQYLLLDDELDEMDQVGPAADGNTTTYIWDISSLASPVNTGLYFSPVHSIDHNQYVVSGLSYQANYGSGLRIVDVSSVAEDPTGAGFSQVGFFDAHPEDDAIGGEVEFVGTWGVYPFFSSGYILLNSIERGVYSLKYTGGSAYAQ
ncbi:hypothetical protein BDY21DRAFT_285195 [Lineolata rhizophorae]|uniref:Regulatory P domain-containing protein n=1 Tax=Lineolata rhizophorae TaxID=578093 RepID=A0A6A6P2M9_9PEZI|nr:hypothetical protein BDY21DRAFT_285195 [Lineolata rhizophorae]